MCWHTAAELDVLDGDTSGLVCLVSVLGFCFDPSLFTVLKKDLLNIWVWEAGQRTDAHLTDQWNPTEKPRHLIEKIVQLADSVPCLGKKFSMMPSDRIENSAR